MRKLITLILPILLLSSCIKYEEPTLVSLSGEYIIDKITLTNVEDTSTIYQDVYLPGDVFLDNLASSPMDSIVCGLTRWHFDYSVISFSPVGLNNGQVLWQYQYFYHIYNDWYYTDLGYIEFELNNAKSDREFASTPLPITNNESVFPVVLNLPETCWYEPSATVP